MAENLHRWQQLCSGSDVEFIRKSAAHTIVASYANFKAKEPFWYTFQLFTKNCTRMAPWLKNLIFDPRSHCGTIFGEKLKSVPEWLLGFEICIAMHNCVSGRFSNEFNIALHNCCHRCKFSAKFTKSVPEWLLCTGMAPS